MSKRLTRKVLDSMFKAYCEKQSSQYVSDKCAISRTTVDKYRKKDDWDDRLKTVQTKAVEKSNETLAESIASNLKYVKFAKGKILEFMTTNRVVSNNPMADLDKAVRLELLLRGEADSRVDLAPSKLREMTTEKLLELQEILEKKETDGNADTNSDS